MDREKASDTRLGGREAAVYLNLETSIRSVTFVATSQTLGGGELFTLRLAEALGSRCDVAIAGAPGTPIMADAYRRNIPQCELDLGKKLGRRTAIYNGARMIAARRRLQSFVDTHDSRDWIVFQYTWEKLLWDSRSKGARIAVIEHGPVPAPLLRFGATRRSLRATFLTCDALFAASEPAAADVERVSGRVPQPLRAGVDPLLISSARHAAAAIRASLGVSDTVPLLVYAGRIAENKGLFDLLAAASRNPNLHVLFIGEGPAEKALRANAEPLGSRAIIRHRVDDILPYLAAADATCLLTSDPGEGRPQLAVESVAVGTPVLGNAKSTAMTALVAEGIEGLHLVDVTNHAAVDAGVTYVLTMALRCASVPSWADTAVEFLSGLSR